MRLIDADVLKKEMLETYEYEYPTASGAFDEFASRIVPNIISNAPTVDAVPVVRCKDCECGYNWMNDGTGKIGKCAFLIGDNQYVVADGFCNLGERKGGE